jgi:CsoR family transcriptional regulator, copper-sensing transcriptional repressor
MQKHKTIHRIKIIQGHLKSIEKMIEDDKYCIDIIHQSLAVQAALKKMDQEILSDHIQCCVVEQIKNNQEDRAVKELLKLFLMK